MAKRSSAKATQNISKGGEEQLEDRKPTLQHTGKTSKYVAEHLLIWTITEPLFGIYFAVSWIFMQQTTSGYHAV